MYTYIYIYIEREIYIYREGERDVYTYVSCIHAFVELLICSYVYDCPSLDQEGETGAGEHERDAEGGHDDAC